MVVYKKQINIANFKSITVNYLVTSNPSRLNLELLCSVIQSYA